MKKLITTLVLVAMLLTTLGVAAAAESYMDKVPATCEYEVTVKKADPSVVKKDGVIDVDGGEYIKAEVPFSELSVNFHTADYYMAADAMARTMEYYFSWDETHGFNFAVKYLAKGNVEGTEYDGYYTNYVSGEGSENPAVPQDNFMSNMGLCFASGAHKETEGWSLLYYAIGKKLDGSSYLNGHWGQLGNSGAYAPVGGQDFEVTYPGDGSVIYEWSIPFAEFIDVAPADGVSFGFTLSAAAGNNNFAESGNIIANCWSVALGQCAWLCQVSDDNAHATAILSDEPVKEKGADDTTAADETGPLTTAPAYDTTKADDTTKVDAPTQPATTEIVTSIATQEVVVTDNKGDAVTDADGNEVTEIVTEVVTSIVTAAPTDSANGNKAPVTGDPMVIAAVVAAISACGVVVAKKRK